MSKTLLFTFFQAAESPPEAEDVCGDTNGQRLFQAQIPSPLSKKLCADERPKTFSLSLAAGLLSFFSAGCPMNKKIKYYPKTSVCLFCISPLPP
jgi:hypothetical protein